MAAKTTAAKKSAAKAETKAETKADVKADVEATEAEAKAKAAAIESAKLADEAGKVVTSVSSGPNAVPVVEAAGAGADRAAQHEPEHALKVKDGLVQPGAGQGNKGTLSADMSAGELFASADIGTTFTVTGSGVKVSTPIGGGTNRTFAGPSIEAAFAEMDAFFDGAPAMIHDLGAPEGKAEE